ncbi:MAG: GNAT family N-acetyltransferase [bacterium]|nr:GNAT family N-acetyltransferase [bacterium]
MAAHGDLNIGPPSDEVEIKAFCKVVSQALYFPTVDLDAWVLREGHENVRVARRGGTVVGGLVIKPMGQWIGGRSVPMVGVRAVGVAAEHRGTGVGSSLMRAAVEELHDRGVPISVLYPATQPVYRRPGFERAGVRLSYRLPTAGIDVRGRELELRRVETSDHAELRRVYDERARRTTGNLDRNDWLWQRILDPLSPGTAPQGYLAARDGRVEGYVFFTHQAGTHSFGESELMATDLVTLSADASRTLLGLFANHRSTIRYVNFVGAPADPWLHLLAEQSATLTERIDWLLRLIDVPAALEARGYAAGVSGELHLEVADDRLNQNDGRFTLTVADGSSRVTEGGRGDFRVDVRGLAAIYTGYLAPGELTATGLVDAPDHSLATAGALFAGPAPWMPDMF